MQNNIIIQRATNEKMPTSTKLKRWTKAALTQKMKHAELTLRIVSSAEITDLNLRYRHKNYATNVLSFPFDMPKEIDSNQAILGDIVVCAEVVNREAAEQSKTCEAHWAHMIVHGTLHLLGYDHESIADANIMEKKEIEILHRLGFENPYKENNLHE